MKRTKNRAKNAVAKSKQKANGLVQKYVGTETKKKFLPSIAKTGIELVAAAAGGGLGAAFGYWSVAAGFAATLGGHLLGDKTGLIKTVGLSAMVYGIAKGIENSKADSENSMNGVSLGSVTDGVKSRMVDFKDNLVHAFYLGKLIGEKQEEPTKSEEIGSLNLDTLDVFDDFADQQIEQQAINDERQLEMLDDIQPAAEELDEEPEEEYTEFEELETEVIDFNAM
ncbi:MAG: hypothetical protein Crog4KO_06690 [Crocinitomicaceae bacterium]